MTSSPYNNYTYDLSPCGNTLLATVNSNHDPVLLKQGHAQTEIQAQMQDIRLQLMDDALVVQREELVYTHSTVDHVDAAILNKERTVHLRRERVGGLGLSVKGGAEHNLPVLVSRIFKDQAADKTGQLFVGDAILKVNSEMIENYCHDEAVQCLKNAGDNVTLTVKYFRPASLFLTTRKKENGHASEENGNSTGSEEVYTPDQQWMDMVTIPLLCAYVTRYSPGGDDMRVNTFEVYNMDGTSSTGAIVCSDPTTTEEWVENTTAAADIANQNYVNLINKTMLPPHQVQQMCWVSEYTRQGTGTLRPRWKSVFFAFKGTDVLLFDTPPIKSKDWLACRSIYKIYECLLRVVKGTELQDERKHCLVLETGHGATHYLSVESRQEVLKLEKVWYRANYHSINHIQNKTFGCTWRGNICGLTLDINVGYSLYDSETKSYMWSYRFSQLKGSSDDGDKQLTMHFYNDQSDKIEIREVECTNLQTLLFAMHAFLSAKLASVDPAFLANL